MQMYAGNFTMNTYAQKDWYALSLLKLMLRDLQAAAYMQEFSSWQQTGTQVFTLCMQLDQALQARQSGHLTWACMWLAFRERSLACLLRIAACKSDTCLRTSALSACRACSCSRKGNQQPVCRSPCSQLHCGQRQNSGCIWSSLFQHKSCACGPVSWKSLQRFDACWTLPGMDGGDIAKHCGACWTQRHVEHLCLSGCQKCQAAKGSILPPSLQLRQPC